MTSGLPFLSLRHFLETRHGNGAFTRVRRALADRKALDLELVLQPRAWYPTAAFVHALDIGRELFGPDDFYEEFGLAAAEYEIHVFGRFILRFTSPFWMLERGNEVWGRSHDTGRWIVKREAERRLTATLDGFGLAHEGFCRTLVGWFRRAVPMTGVRDVVIEHPFCRGRAGAACLFDGRWR